MREIRNIINIFSRDIEVLVAGDPRRPDGLLQQITAKNELFRKTIRFLLPSFMTYQNEDIQEAADITEKLFSIFTHGKDETNADEELSKGKYHISIGEVITRIKQ